MGSEHLGRTWHQMCHHVLVGLFADTDRLCWEYNNHLFVLACWRSSGDLQWCWGQPLEALFQMCWRYPKGVLFQLCWEHPWGVFFQVMWRSVRTLLVQQSSKPSAELSLPNISLLLSSTCHHFVKLFLLGQSCPGTYTLCLEQHSSPTLQLLARSDGYLILAFKYPMFLYGKRLGRVFKSCVKPIIVFTKGSHIAVGLVRWEVQMF